MIRDLKPFLNFPLAVCIAFLCSCTQDAKQEERNISNSDPAVKDQPLKNFDWLVGSWSNKSKEGAIGEEWYRINDSLLRGSGFELAGTDTVFKEDISILLFDNKIFYVPVIENQNDGQPVMFLVTSSDSVSFTCENKEHDFPQIIYYKQESPNVLYAMISGKMKDKEVKREFRYRRSLLRLMP
jgi:hypothetical protein